jgi:N-formylmaleamate deformylase
MTSTWQQGDIQTGNMMMHYTRTGNPTGTRKATGSSVIILAHGFSDNGLCWLPTAQALCTEYEVILPDARGHGQSSRFHPFGKYDSAKDLAGFIHALGLEQPVVGGHSMGAGTAARLGAHYPGLVRALILEDPAWFEPSKSDNKSHKSDDPWRRQLEQFQTQSLDEITAQGKKNSPLWADIEWAAWSESKKQFDMNTYHTPGTHEDWKKVAKKISKPTLLLTAEPEKGAIVTVDTAEIVRSLNPLIQVVHIPGAGHNIRRENFPAFMEAVWGFLKTI